MEVQAVQNAFLATVFTWGVTAVGAAGVFVCNRVNRNFLDGALGFTAGVMIAAVIGAVSVLYMRNLLPFALAFAAGAMIYVSVEEIIPESQTRGTDSATIGAIIGFALMMTLDVAFGV